MLTYMQTVVPDNQKTSDENIKSIVVQLQSHYFRNQDFIIFDTWRLVTGKRLSGNVSDLAVIHISNKIVA